MGILSRIYSEEAHDLQARAEADMPIRIKPEYLRRLRYQMFRERYEAVDEQAAARNSVTGY